MLKQFHLTPTDMSAIKDLCRNMISQADNNPEYNHIGVAGVFVDGSERSYPYAMIYVGCSSMTKEQLFKLVDLCNSYYHAYRVFEGTTYFREDRAFRTEDMINFVQIISGDCVDLNTKRTIKYFQP